MPVQTRRARRSSSNVPPSTTPMPTRTASGQRNVLQDRSSRRRAPTNGREILPQPSQPQNDNDDGNSNKENNLYDFDKEELCNDDQLSHFEKSFDPDEFVSEDEQDWMMFAEKATQSDATIPPVEIESTSAVIPELEATELEDPKDDVAQTVAIDDDEENRRPTTTKPRAAIAAPKLDTTETRPATKDNDAKEASPGISAPTATTTKLRPSLAAPSKPTAITKLVESAKTDPKATSSQPTTTTTKLCRKATATTTTMELGPFPWKTKCFGAWGASESISMPTENRRARLGSILSPQQRRELYVYSFRTQDYVDYTWNASFNRATIENLSSEFVVIFEQRRNHISCLIPPMGTVEISFPNFSGTAYLDLYSICVRWICGTDTEFLCWLEDPMSRKALWKVVTEDYNMLERLPPITRLCVNKNNSNSQVGTTEVSWECKVVFEGMVSSRNTAIGAAATMIDTNTGTISTATCDIKENHNLPLSSSNMATSQSDTTTTPKSRPTQAALVAISKPEPTAISKPTTPPKPFEAADDDKENRHPASATRTDDLLAATASLNRNVETSKSSGLINDCFSGATTAHSEQHIAASKDKDMKGDTTWKVSAPKPIDAADDDKEYCRPSSSFACRINHTNLSDSDATKVDALSYSTEDTLYGNKVASADNDKMAGFWKAITRLPNSRRNRYLKLNGYTDCSYYNSVECKPGISHDYSYEEMGGNEFTLTISLNNTSADQYIAIGDADYGVGYGKHVNLVLTPQESISVTVPMDAISFWNPSGFYLVCIELIPDPSIAPPDIERALASRLLDLWEVLGSMPLTSSTSMGKTIYVPPPTSTFMDQLSLTQDGILADERKTYRKQCLHDDDNDDEQYPLDELSTSFVDRRDSFPAAPPSLKDDLTTKAPPVRARRDSQGVRTAAATRATNPAVSAGNNGGGGGGLGVEPIFCGMAARNQ